MSDAYETMEFINMEAFRLWLDENHASIDGMWLKIHKVNSGLSSITYPEAVDVALCFGWIDGLKRSFDENSYVQKFTPRRKRSLWSKRNVEYIERLSKAGLMTPRGLKEVELAKADGRWEAAYDGPSSMKFTDSFLNELRKHPVAQEKFDALNKTERYTIGWQLQTAKTQKIIEARQKRIIDKLLEID